MNTDNLKSRQHTVEWVKEHKVYKELSGRDLAIVIDDFELLDIPRTGIWEERYPHKIDANSSRLKEISQYDIAVNDRILHFKAANNHLCDIIFLAYDSIEVTHYPNRFDEKDMNLFNLISKEGRNISSSLNYPISNEFSFDKEQAYDKIVFDALGRMFYNKVFNYDIIQIRKILKDDGVLIIGGNYYQSPFDRPFYEDITVIDDKVDRVLKLGFKLKEKYTWKMNT